MSSNHWAIWPALLLFYSGGDEVSPSEYVNSPGDSGLLPSECETWFLLEGAAVLLWRHGEQMSSVVRLCWGVESSVGAQRRQAFHSLGCPWRPYESVSLQGGSN